MCKSSLLFLSVSWSQQCKKPYSVVLFILANISLELTRFPSLQHRYKGRWFVISRQGSSCSDCTQPTTPWENTTRSIFSAVFVLSRSQLISESVLQDWLTFQGSLRSSDHRTSLICLPLFKINAFQHSVIEGLRFTSRQIYTFLSDSRVRHTLHLHIGLRQKRTSIFTLTTLHATGTCEAFKCIFRGWPLNTVVWFA